MRYVRRNGRDPQHCSGDVRNRLVHCRHVFFALLACFILCGAVFGQETQASTPVQPAAELAPHAAAPTEGGAHGAGGEHTAEPGLFNIDPTILISQTLNFFILLVILQAFLFKPIGGILAERAKKIADDMKDIDDKRAAAEAVKQDYQKRVAHIEEESYQIRQKAISEGQKARESIMTEAKIKADTLLSKAKVEIGLERDKAWVQLKEKMVQLTMLAAEKVVDESLDDRVHRELIRKTIERLDEHPAGETSH